MDVQDRATIEDKLRRYGMSGEDAFYLISFTYARHYDLTRILPDSFLERGEVLTFRIKDESLSNTLDSLADSDPEGDELSLWYQYFLGRRFREGSGKFFTPKQVAAAMARMLPRKKGGMVMDPTCGGGTFLMEVAKLWASVPFTLVANDIDPSLVVLAQLSLSLGAARDKEKLFLTTDIFAPNKAFTDWFGKVDGVLANPPFSLQLTAVKIPSPLYSEGYRTSDAVFLDVCHSLLKPHGRLVCLQPHSIIANVEYQRLRALFEERWKLRGVISLPEGVFQLAAGTTTRADIIIADKRAVGDSEVPKAVFASVPTVGIRLNGRSQDAQRNQLAELVEDEKFLKALELS